MDAETVKDNANPKKVETLEKRIEDLESQWDANEKKLTDEFDAKVREAEAMEPEYEKIMADGEDPVLFKRVLEKQCMGMLRRLYMEVKYSYKKTEQVIRKSVMKQLLVAANTSVLKQAKMMELQMEFTEKAIENKLEKWDASEVQAHIQERIMPALDNEKHEALTDG